MESDLEKLQELIKKYPVMEVPINDCIWENCISEFDVYDNPDATPEMRKAANDKYSVLIKSSLEEKFKYITDRKRGSISGYLKYATKRVQEGNLETIVLFGN